MATPTGRTLFKKKEGILALDNGRQAVTWTPVSGGPPTVSLPIANITNLQQTPDSSAKVMLKIFEKSTAGSEPATYLFHFNSSEARSEASAVRDVLSKILADLRSVDTSVPRATAATSSPATGAPSPAGNKNIASASASFASAVNAVPASSRWFDDNHLKVDIDLQRSLMKTDLGLHQTYGAAMKAKPDSISTAAFNSQFWSTRINLLRAHAIEINQKKGAYNVLSTVKPRTVDGELKLNISVEQVHMILTQHPLVKRIYDENVPKLSEAEFWSRFFLSKLSKKLRGERVNDNDGADALFDRYDANENTLGFQSKIMSQSVPHIIDLKANEENQGGVRSGNAKDVEMRPRANIPIVRTLNSLSEKIMANVAPSDALTTDSQESHDAYHKLALRDLGGDVKEHRIMLNVKEQNKFFSKQDSAPSKNQQIFSSQNTADVLKKIRQDIHSFGSDNVGGTGPPKGIYFEDDSDSEGDDQKITHVGSRAPIREAEIEVMNGVLQQRSQKYGHVTDATSPMGLPTRMTDECALTHTTTVEFLHQFWNAFLSGDPDRAAELQYLAESLKRSTVRIAAVGEEAENEREDIIRKRRQEILKHFERTRQKIPWKPAMVGGGREAVLKIMQPTLDALNKAQADYSRAWATEGVQISTE